MPSARVPDAFLKTLDIRYWIPNFGDFGRMNTINDRTKIEHRYVVYVPFWCLEIALGNLRRHKNKGEISMNLQHTPSTQG